MVRTNICFTTILAVCLIMLCTPTHAQTFTDIGAGLPGVSNSSLAWGDCDNDGKLEIALTGYISGRGYVTNIYLYQIGNFIEITTEIAGIDYGTVAWGDYDNDGDLDLALAGEAGYNSYICKIYRNDIGRYTDIGAGLIGVSYSSLAWGDYDNDGDLDLALAGDSASGRISKIYRNNNGIFTDIAAGIVGVSKCSLAWGDYDNDGDLDLALSGSYYDSTVHIVSKLYRNDNGMFTDIGAGLVGVWYCSLAWGDYDNDGDLDLALAGSSGSDRVSKIYRNDNGTFTDIEAGLTGIMGNTCYSIAWGDCDNDGDLDLALAGNTGSHRVSKIYRNDSGVFIDIGASLSGIRNGSVAWGDYDNDGDLDLSLAGTDSTNVNVTKIYRNDGCIPNTPPTAPTALTASLSGNDVTFSWNAGSDTQTAASGLTYNLRVGSAPGKDDIFSGMANLSTGLRRIPSIGNAQKKLSWTLKGLPLYKSFYWSVQAIDTAFAGSAWSDDGPTIRRPKISGHISKPEGSLIQGVTVTASDGGGSTTTDAAGYYEVGVPEGWSGTVTPTKTEYIFTPPSKTYSNVTSDQLEQDFTAIGPPFISGYVRTPDGTGRYFVQLISSNGGGSAMTDRNGYYKLKVPLGWSGTITPNASPYYVFDPQSITYTNVTADITEQNYTALICPIISGYVRNQLGVAVTDIFIKADNGIESTLTDSNGYYKLYVPPGWSGTLTPSNGLCSFDPLIRTYTNTTTDQSDQDFAMSSAGFTDIGANLIKIKGCSLAWGDYDADGDLDLVLGGYSESGGISKIYRNDNGMFSDIGAGNIVGGSFKFAWGDYDNDGDLDLALAGGKISKIYRNDNCTFTDINAGLSGVQSCSIAWGDYDNDGDLDLALAGDTGIIDSSTNKWIYVSKIYRNDNGIFTDVGAALNGVYRCSLAWGDYDNDGDLDLALSGSTGNSPYHISNIYKNVNGTFSDIGAGLIGVGNCSLAWGDYDNDGDLDLALAGTFGDYSNISNIYRNDNGTFTDIGAGLTSVRSCSLAWGDYDNDGSLDITLSGEHYDGNTHNWMRISKIYHNANGIFTEIGTGLPRFQGTFAWGDYDKDGDLDLALAGQAFGGASFDYPICRIYRNDGETFNSAPDSPSGLSVSTTGSDTTFNWSAGSDAETPVSGLAYNLRVGTAPGLDDIFSGMANSSSGLRLLPSIGNAQKSLSWTLDGLGSDKAYYWSVQSIDTAFAGSKWADEKVIAPYTVSGKIVLGDFKGDITKVPINVKMSKQGGTTTNVNMNLRSDGSFTLGIIEPGTYDITFKATHWLSKTVRNVVIE